MKKKEKIELITSIIDYIKFNPDKTHFICNIADSKTKVFSIAPGYEVYYKKDFPEFYDMIMKVGQSLIHEDIPFEWGDPWLVTQLNSFNDKHVQLAKVKSNEFKLHRLNILLKELES